MGNKQQAPFSRVEPRCKICQSPARLDIDLMVVTGWQREYMRDMFNSLVGEEWISSSGLSRHAREHTSLDDPPIRSFVAGMLVRLQQQGWYERINAEPPESVEQALQLLIQAGMVALHTGMTVVEPGDVLRAAALLDRFEHNRTPEDDLRTDFNIFLAAVQRIVPEELWQRIFDEYQKEQAQRRTPAKVPLIMRSGPL